MNRNVVGSKKSYFALIFTVLHIYFVVSDDKFVPAKSQVPFHNLIPRFKMPRGNLLRYKIPQWEVLYFLKYGVVPFIFYDPNFNRTSFVSQVQKFKMYFDDTKSNRTSQKALKDDESFKEFLRTHHYPNINQLPENALSITKNYLCQNNKVADEINGLLQSVSVNSENTKDAFETGTGEQFIPFSSLDIFMEDLYPATVSSANAKEGDKRKISKKTDVPPNDLQPRRKSRQSFWNTFINRYPLTWKLRKSILQFGNPREFLMTHDPFWFRGSFPYGTQYKGALLSSVLRRRSSGIGTRNVNIEGEVVGGEDDELSTSNAANAPARGGKNFQTQGWR